MEFSDEQVADIRTALIYYMNRNVSIKNPRYAEYEVILQLLTESIKATKSVSYTHLRAHETVLDLVCRLL